MKKAYRMRVYHLVEGEPTPRLWVSKEIVAETEEQAKEQAHKRYREFAMRREEAEGRRLANYGLYDGTHLLLETARAELRHAARS